MASILAVLLFPFIAVFNLLGYLFTFSFWSGTFGFGCGLLFGLIFGYVVFISSLPTEVQAPQATSISKKDGQIDNNILKRILPEMPAWVKSPDYDKVDWINRILFEMWPYINTAVTNEVRAQVTPLLAQYKPAQLESISFETLSLGNLPPFVAGIKVYDTTDDEMIFEPVLKWAGAPDIVLAIRALGLKATVQLVDFTLFATVRITFKPLVDVFPCFSKITVCLMEKPVVDFGLKIIGGDVMAIPGLDTYVQETIKDVVASMMLWPKTLEVYKALDPSNQKNPVGWLYVSNLKAKGLKNVERFGKSDPYVKLTLGERIGTKMTTVKWDNLSPSWEGEEFQLLVRDPQTQELQLQVLDKEKTGPDRLMSVGSIPLKQLAAEEAKVITVHLQEEAAKGKAGAAPVDVGQLLATVLYRPFNDGEDFEVEAQTADLPENIPPGGGILVVHVHSGDGLESSHGSTNPYVKIRFRDQERKTKVVKRSSSCTFDDEAFRFTVPEPPREDKLQVLVYSKNSGVSQLFHSKDLIGHCEIPLGDVIANGRINDIYQLSESKSGRIKIELEWKEKAPPVGESNAQVQQTAQRETTAGGQNHT